MQIYNMAESVDIAPRFAATNAHTSYHTQTHPIATVLQSTPLQSTPSQSSMIPQPATPLISNILDAPPRGFFSNEYLLIGIIIVLVTVIVLLIVYVVRVKNASTRDEQLKCEEIQCNPEMNEEMFNVASRPFIPRSTQPPPIQRSLRQPGGNVHIETVNETKSSDDHRADDQRSVDKRSVDKRSDDKQPDMHIDPIDFNRINAADETVRDKNEYSSATQEETEEAKTSNETEQHIEEQEESSADKREDQPPVAIVRQRGRPRGTHN
jgi:type IV secretory pathway VirB10-like protein